VLAVVREDHQALLHPRELSIRCTAAVAELVLTKPTEIGSGVTPEAMHGATPTTADAILKNDRR
jgi:hypothetical protein